MSFVEPLTNDRASAFAYAAKDPRNALMLQVLRRMHAHLSSQVSSTSSKQSSDSNNKLAGNNLCPINETRFGESRSVSNFRPMCPIKIRGHPTFALIDSGNVVVNAISEKFAKELFKGADLSKHVEPLKHYKYIGTAEHGAKMKVLGITRETLSLRFGGAPTQFNTRPIVIRGLSMNVNIAGPFLSEHGIDQLHSQGALRVKGKLVKLVTYKASCSTSGKAVQSCTLVRSSAVQMEQGSNNTLASLQKTVTQAKKRFSASAYVAWTKIIPANAAAYVELRIPEIEHGKLQDGEGILEVSERFAEKTSGHPTITAVVKTKHWGRCFTSVLNLTDEVLEIPEGLFYGTFRSYDKVQEPKGRISAMSAWTTDLKKPTTTAAKVKWIEQEFKLREAPWLENDAKAYQQALDLLLEYTDILSFNEEYGKTDLIQHEIHTHDVAPIRMKGKPLNPVMQEKLKEQMDNWRRQDVIEPSNSPWSFGLLPVDKPNGKIRWCVDYRRLNDITLKDAYNLPNIEDNLARLAHSRVFSTVDGSGAFHAVTIKPEHREKTAFSTPWGLWQFKQMPFGLCNAPSTYSRLVQRVLEDIPTTIALPYLDDCCIHSKNLPDHFKALRRVFDAHRKAKLMLQPAKCHLFRKEVDYLGHKITAKGILPRDEYIAIVRDWPLPKTIKEWRAFLGKAAYYRKFIPKFSQISGCLYNLLSKETEQDPKNVKVGDAEKRAFEEIKESLISAPVLAYPDFSSSAPFILDTDWSKDPGAIGGVLSQVQDGEERVICYGARKLTKAERNYSSNKGELLAVIHFMRAWRYYFQHRPFILRTDHQALQWIRTMEEPKGMVLRWLETLSNNNFTIQFREGKKHGNADALSRTEHAREPTEEEQRAAEEEACNQLQALIEEHRISPSELRKRQEADEDLRKVRQWVKTKKKPARKEIRQESTTLRQYLTLYELLYLNENDVLYRRAVEGEFFTEDRICLPSSLQDFTIKSCHEDTGGHMGVNITQQRMIQRFYFPGIYKAVESFIGSCLICQKKAGRAKDQRHTLISVQEGSPFQKISIDYVGPLRQSRNGNIYLLTVRDCFTRWLEAIPTDRMTAERTAQLLETHIFSRFGVPEQMHSDQGTQFTSETFDDICKILNIRKTETPAYNPKSNPVERAHRDLNAVLRAITQETDQDWEEALGTALLALRTARNRHTGVTPFYAMYGREAKIPIDLIYHNHQEWKPDHSLYGKELEERMQAAYRHMRVNIKASIERARINYDGKLHGEPLEPDHLVWLFTPVINPNKGRKHSVYWSGPWRVVEKLSTILFKIRTEGDWNKRKLEIVVSIDRLKRYHPNCYHLPAKMDLKRTDVIIADEFLEQGDRRPDDLPQFNPPAKKARVVFGGDPDEILDRPAYSLGAGTATQSQPLGNALSAPPMTQAAPSSQTESPATVTQASGPTAEDMEEDETSGPVLQEETESQEEQAEHPAARVLDSWMETTADRSEEEMQSEGEDLEIEYDDTPEIEHEDQPAVDQEMRPAVEQDLRPAVEQEVHPALDREVSNPVEMDHRPAVGYEDIPAVEQERRLAVGHDERHAVAHEGRLAVGYKDIPAIEHQERRLRPRPSAASQGMSRTQPRLAMTFKPAAAKAVTTQVTQGETVSAGRRAASTRQIPLSPSPRVEEVRSEDERRTSLPPSPRSPRVEFPASPPPSPRAVAKAAEPEKEKNTSAQRSEQSVREAAPEKERVKVKVTVPTPKAIILPLAKFLKKNKPPPIKTFEAKSTVPFFHQKTYGNTERWQDITKPGASSLPSRKGKEGSKAETGLAKGIEARQSKRLQPEMTTEVPIKYRLREASSPPPSTSSGAREADENLFSPSAPPEELCTAPTAATAATAPAYGPWVHAPSGSDVSLSSRLSHSEEEIRPPPRDQNSSASQRGKAAAAASSQRRPATDSDSGEKRGARQTYLKVSKGRQSDDVTHRDPHQCKRGKKRIAEQPMCSSTSEEEMTEESGQVRGLVRKAKSKQPYSREVRKSALRRQVSSSSRDPTDEEDGLLGEGALLP